MLARARLEFSGGARHRFIAVKPTGLGASIHHWLGGWIVKDGGSPSMRPMRIRWPMNRSWTR